MIPEPIAESKFDCVDRDGNTFTATVWIGNPTSHDRGSGRTEQRFSVTFDPFFPQRIQGGDDSLTAL